MGKTWRAAWDAAVELRWTGCSCGGSFGFPETDWAFVVFVTVEDMVAGSTRGIWVDVVVVLAVKVGGIYLEPSTFGALPSALTAWNLEVELARGSSPC